MPHSIKITGIAPPDLAGRPAAERLHFWNLTAPIALRVKDQELAAGLDAEGDPLLPIRPLTRKYRRSAMTPSGKGDPNAPPLMPAHQKSRVRSLLAARAFPTHCELYWRYDPFTGGSFDVILNYQRAMGRDVFGVSADGKAKIRELAWKAWDAWKKHGGALDVRRSAHAAAALSAGPQSRIAGIIAGSALPNAGARARESAGVGSLNTRWLTRGIQAPTVRELKASKTRSGGLTAEAWRRYWTEETGGGGGAVSPPVPRPIRPTVAAMKPAKPKVPPKPKPVLPKPAPPLSPREQALADALLYGKSLGYDFHVTDRSALKARGWSDADIKSSPAFYASKEGRLYINPLSTFWDDPAQIVANAIAEKWWASPEKFGIIDHEVAHRKHHEALGNDYLKPMLRMKSSFTAAEIRLIKHEVSVYASTKPVELIAEVQAGVAAGKRYSQQIWDLYRKFGGPPIS